MSEFTAVKLRLGAVIDGVATFDISQFAMAHGLNEIPTASLELAVGRDTKRQDPADAHKFFNELDPESIVEVYLQMDSVDTANRREFWSRKIFEGHPVGRGWRRSENNATLTLPLIHWLGDLNYASAASASSHPGNPSNISYPAIFRLLGSCSTARTGANLEPSWVSVVSKSLVNVGNLDDIWGKILWEWFKCTANQDPVDLAFGGTGSGNAEIQSALSRIGPNPDGQPLDLDLSESTADIFVAEGIRSALKNEAGGNWINTTLWGKLIGEFAPAYLFSVVPRVNDALIVPFTAGLQGDPWRTLQARDYMFIDMNRQLNQVLRAVGITHSSISKTGADLNSGGIPLQFGGLGGVYKADNMDTGMVLLKDAPKWLGDTELFNRTVAESTGLEGIVGAAVDRAPEGGLDAAELVAGHDTMVSMMDRYAHHLYILQSLKGAVGEITGKVRFDIAPGSNIKIEAGKSLNVTDDEITEDIYATVVKTQTVLDAQHSRAGTSFLLSHIRNEKENTEPGTSVAKPPLYKEAWQGAELVP